MTTLRWFGLYCILLGMLACSTSPGGSTVHHSKKPGDLSEPFSNSYVGLKIPPMPRKHETEVGYLLGPEDESQYAVEVVNLGSKKIVWMERFLYHDEKGRAHWEIIAALPPQLLPADYQFSSGNCLSDNKPQPQIVAILKMEDQKALAQIHKAWMADPHKKIFEPLPLEGIRCQNQKVSH